MTNQIKKQSFEEFCKEYTGWGYGDVYEDYQYYLAH